MHRGGVAQLGERRVRNAKVGSSILLLSTNISRPTVLSWAFLFGLFRLQAYHPAAAMFGFEQTDRFNILIMNA